MPHRLLIPKAPLVTISTLRLRLRPLSRQEPVQCVFEEIEVEHCQMHLQVAVVIDQFLNGACFGRAPYFGFIDCAR
jgi:hypothetical protein